jgi:NADH-quinone oxidoreductase subunit K
MNTVFQQVDISHYIYLSSVLFSIGLFGVLFRRNAIVLLMCIELMFVFFIMVVAAAEAAVGLAILVMVYRNTRNTTVNFLSNLKG